MFTRILLMLAAASVTAATGSSGQSRAGTLAGRIVDAMANSPIVGAEVVLLSGIRLAEADSLTSRAMLGLPHTRSTLTVVGGVYSFNEISDGAYVLRVDRIGYRSATVEVEFNATGGPGISVALEVEPIALAPLFVERGASPNAPLEMLGIPPSGRVAMERYRATQSLASDTRIISMHDLVESATMVEMDFFRAMHRLPGVASRDDWSAELWTRGAAWGETRIYVDDIPLFNPLHGFGVFSGFSYQGVGASVFHPGARMPTHSEGAAAVLELSSRSGVEAEGFEGGADLSLGSVHTWLRTPLQEGRGGIGVTARRSYVDVLAGAVANEDEGFPFSFSDVQGRLDLATPIGQLEVSGLWESDVLSGEVPDLLHGTTADWGNVSGQATLHFRPLGLPGRLTVGGTSYRARVREIESQADSSFSAPHESPLDHSVDYATARLGLGREGLGWRGGVDLTRQSVAFYGPQPLPYSDQGLILAIPDLETSGSLTRGAVWGGWRVRALPSVEVDLGLRVGVGTGGIDAQPASITRFRLSPSSTLSLAAGRYLQYTQSPAPIGPRIEESLQTGRYWTLAGSEAPPLDTRIVSVGGEHWLSDHWMMSATLYQRQSFGNLLPDPREGFLIQRSPWVTGRVVARGLDATVRRLAGRWTGSVGYSYGRAIATAAGTEFPSPTDRPHTIDVASVLHVSSSMSLQIAYTYARGFPFVRTMKECLNPDCTQTGLLLDAPFQRRGPDYSSLDVMFSSTHRIARMNLAWYVQVRNALDHDNAVSYGETNERCLSRIYEGDACGGGLPKVLLDEFVPGMPLAPALGLRITF